MKKKENISDNIQGTPKENPFIVPDGYFENFSGRLQQRISGREKIGKGHAIYLFLPRIAWAVSIAAVFIIGISVYKFLIQSPKNTELNKADISAYLQEQAYSLDENTLYDEDQSFEEDLAEGAKSDTLDQEDYKDEIVQYLLQEDVEVSQITDKL